MKFKLRGDLIEGITPLGQVLINRGIEPQELMHYMEPTDEDINEPDKLDNMRAGALALGNAIKRYSKVYVVVDADADGMTSSALLINWLYRWFPHWVENKVFWKLHEEKQHGLSDFPIDVLSEGDLVICPDSASNDYEIHKALKDRGITTLVLDHHEADKVSEDAIIINNMLCDYPNKNLSGVGITWQFCRYCDKVLGGNEADNFLDLVAIGNIADMMSLTSIETRRLIVKGLLPENMHNPFIRTLADKNSYSLGKVITPIGAAFYIVPFINAMMRSGTIEEKLLMFESMLNFKAKEEILSTKRGHRLGETETRVEQAVRTAVNVKARQTKAQDKTMENLEKLVEEKEMLDNKALIFAVDAGMVDKNIAGLAANKLSPKYQRPCCILSRTTNEVGEVVYQGSARGYTKNGIEDFKAICSQFPNVVFTAGHANAFGLGIKEEDLSTFLDYLNAQFENVSSEIVYLTDFLFNNGDLKSNALGDVITDIARYADLWGQDMEEPLIGLDHIIVKTDNISLKSRDKHPTLVIALANGVELIKFGSSEEEYEQLTQYPFITLDVAGKCSVNEWYGRVTAQLKISDYEVVGYSKFVF